MIGMGRLNPEKLHVSCLPGASPEVLVVPRRYTLTHSDATGDLFLTIGPDYNISQISGLYTRLMRDEVLAEWVKEGGDLSIHVYCHICGGFVFGRAAWRESIFRSELPLVLEAIRYCDRELFIRNPELDNVPIWVHFRGSGNLKEKVEQWEVPSSYKIE